jgi:CubicO group peptidase (beta-lactamase class C family)
MGGVAGHAGLFGSIEAVSSLVSLMMQLYRGDEQQILSGAVFRALVNNRVGSRRGGFDTPSVESSSGQYFSAESIGHLGFTGTSLWIDLEQQVGIILLTNRSYLDNGLKKIRGFRPGIHDLAMEGLRAQRSGVPRPL